MLQFYRKPIWELNLQTVRTGLCYNNMKALRFPVGITTLVLFIYLICTQYNVDFPIVFALFVVLHALTIWMVYQILKNGTPSDKTFEDHWYEDLSK